MMTYLIDSSCFIEPHRNMCPIDVAESFWTKVSELCAQSRVRSIDKVKDEIYNFEDDLSAWFKSNVSSDFFIKSETEESIGKYANMANWVNQNCLPKARDKYLNPSKADAYLVAFSATNPSEYTVVTQEVSRPNSQVDLKLPDACRHNGVRCINLMDMLRELGEKY